VAGFAADYPDYDGLGLAALVARGEVSQAEVVAACLARIERVNPRINAVVALTAEAGSRRASAAEGKLRGVPFLLKDLAVLMRGEATTMGSRRVAGARAGHDSEIVARYRRAGLVIVGKTNTPEMGLAVTTEPAHFGATRNPWDPARSAGGSSGGSAAAVAARIVPWAHGTDGGGSLRIPAACCGVFGFKPTRARISLAPDAGERTGGFFTQHAITRSVRDSAALLDVAAGMANGDPYGAPALARPLADEVRLPPGRLRIALQNDAPGGVAVAAECRAAAQAAARLCESLGHAVVEVAPCYDLDALIDAALTIWSAHLAAAFPRPTDEEGLEPFTRFLVEIGREARAADYVRAMQHVHAQGRSIATLLEAHDVLLSPTLAQAPAPLGAFDTLRVASPAAARELFARQFHYACFTMIATAAGTPARSVPLAWSAAGMPLGTQFLGRFGDEATLFRLAAQLEGAHPWSDRRPPLAD
jgi:amidase